MIMGKDVVATRVMPSISGVQEDVCKGLLSLNLKGVVLILQAGSAKEVSCIKMNTDYPLYSTNRWQTLKKNPWWRRKS